MKTIPTQNGPAGSPVHPIDESIRIVPDQWLDPVDFASAFEDRHRPLHIDLGCGMGRFILARAGRFPDINFLGIDRQLNRLKRIDRKARRMGCDNIRLLRAELDYTMSYLIPTGSVDTYYLFYPDPWPKGKHRANRLVGTRFLDAVCRTLKPGGSLHLSTDHRPYHEEMAALFSTDSRFTQTDPLVPTDDERTDFELIFSEKEANRLSFVKAGFPGRSPCPSESQ